MDKKEKQEKKLKVFRELICVHKFIAILSVISALVCIYLGNLAALAVSLVFFFGAYILFVSCDTYIDSAIKKKLYDDIDKNKQQ